MIRIDFSDFFSDQVVSVLKVNRLGQARDHDQGIEKLVSWPGFVDKLIGDNILAVFESSSHLLPIVNEKISQTMPVSP
jgi:class 3 adenylate cyclase